MLTDKKFSIGVVMNRPKRPHSFDAMIKFFQQHYNFATKQDINKLVDKIEDLEKLIKKLPANGNLQNTGRIDKSKPGKDEPTATDCVIAVLKSHKKGATFSDIKEKTGFEDKKLRNIIYRLGKLKKIKHKKRGLYVLSIK